MLNRVLLYSSSHFIKILNLTVFAHHARNMWEKVNIIQTLKILRVNLTGIFRVSRLFVEKSEARGMSEWIG